MPSTISPTIPLTINLPGNENIKTENKHILETCCSCCCKNNNFPIIEKLNKENQTKTIFKYQTKKQQRNSLLSILPSSVSSNRLTSILSGDNKNLLFQNTKNLKSTFESTDQRPFSWAGVNFSQNSLTKNNKIKASSLKNKNLFNISPSKIQSKNDNNNCLEINNNLIKINNLNYEILSTKKKQNINNLENLASKSDIKTSRSLNFNNNNNYLIENNDKTLIQASTSELLNGLGYFIKLKCKKIHQFETTQVVLWMKTVDRALIIQVNFL